jgi:hypothetical protein
MSSSVLIDALSHRAFIGAAAPQAHVLELDPVHLARFSAERDAGVHGARWTQRLHRPEGPREANVEPHPGDRGHRVALLVVVVADQVDGRLLVAHPVDGERKVHRGLQTHLRPVELDRVGADQVWVIERASL